MFRMIYNMIRSMLTEEEPIATNVTSAKCLTFLHWLTPIGSKADRHWIPISL